MSFQAYLDAIKSKTGLEPEAFRALAEEKGLAGPKAKAAEVLAWLANDYGLGRGHGMALYSILKLDGAPPPSNDARLGALFTGGKAVWAPAYEALLASARGWGDVATAPTDTYVSLLRGRGKFAIVQPAVGHLDIGIKLKGAEPTERFAAAGSWNSMVTHRVRVPGGADVDAEILDWMRRAYEAAK